MSLSYIEPGLFDGPRRIRDWPWGDLEPRAYGLIMIDPPWTFELYSDKGEEKSAQAQYRCMRLADIADLPVRDLSAPDCLLWMWATAPMLPRQLAVMDGWGFRYVTSGVWVKTTVNGKIGFGTGYVLRSAHEHFVIGALGEPKTTRSVRSVVMGQAREHSRKPDAAYEAAEQLVTGVRRADVFSRQRRPGWDAFGDEIGKFDEEAASRGHDA